MSSEAGTLADAPFLSPDEPVPASNSAAAGGYRGIPFCRPLKPLAERKAAASYVR